MVITNVKGTEAIHFKLDELMKEKGFSKNKLCVKTGLRFETVQGYYKGTISRVDLYVISEMCRVLQCNIQDIIEFVPPRKREQN